MYKRQQSIFPNDSHANEVAMFEENAKFSTIHVPPGRTGLALKSSKHGPLILSVSFKSVCPSLQPGDIIVSVDGENVSVFIEFDYASFRFVMFRSLHVQTSYLHSCCSGEAYVW